MISGDGQIYYGEMRMRSCLISFLIILSLAPSVAAQTASKYVGQVICCEECWVRADRRTTPFGTPADLAKAAECVGNGDPSLLAMTDNDGETSFYQLEEGRYKKPGRNWLELIGSRVEVTGVVRMKKERRFLRVDSLEVLATPQQIAPQPTVIGTAAELVLPDLFGGEQRLSSLRGRIVILNFWATWCGPCVKEMPDLAAIQNQYAALGVQVVGASADNMTEQKAVREFIGRAKINFPVWLGATTREMGRFGLGPALPGTAVIGRDGRIVAVYQGVIKEADLKKLLDQLIARSQGEARAQIAQMRGAAPLETASVPS
jgi:thiol-disulfide isomerase/thioredoxin